MSALVLFKLRARTKTKGSPVHPHSSFSSVAATSLSPLLLCCCCGAAASAVPRSAMHRGARSAVLIAMHTRTCNMQRVRKKVPLRCSIFFIWRSGLTRGAGTKTATRRRRHHCCCAAAAVLLKNIALPLQAFQRFQHVKYLRVTRS